MSPGQGSRRRQAGSKGRASAGDERRDEEHELVDEIGAQERLGERRPALEQEGLDALLREPGELLFERPCPQLELRIVGQRPPRAV